MIKENKWTLDFPDVLEYTRIRKSAASKKVNGSLLRYVVYVYEG